MSVNKIPMKDCSTDTQKNTSNVVSFPKVILTRIDEDQGRKIRNQSMSTVKTTKMLKSSPRKSPETLNIEKRSRGRPKKEPNASTISKVKKAVKAVKNSKAEVRIKVNQSKSTPKLQQKGSNVLRKTMLQKSSKVTIPIAKKARATPKEIKKHSPEQEKKIERTKPIVPLKMSNVELDSSEDEFLYDELIEELESTPNRTTNITLKPSTGDKPPTILKGGIIKKSSLPPDLKLGTPSEYIMQRFKNTAFETLDIKKSKLSVPTYEEKELYPENKSRPSYVTQTKPTCSSNQFQKNSITPPSSSKNTSQSALVSTKGSASVNMVPKPTLVKKPKIGPKHKVTFPNFSNQDIVLSDEYTEEETLEGIDSNDILPKSSTGNEMHFSSCDFTPSVKSSVNHTIQKESNDPNLDLLRILTDDTDEPVVLESAAKDKAELKHNGDVEMVSMENVNTATDSSHPDIEESPVRTIYDLMNEISLQHPSWNLHIIPETNSFCIAQVTKGRLGLPTLKKCIELDPDNYNAKVYIHQYHIKRFDGVYDSEESILALIQEINSIKA